MMKYRPTMSETTLIATDIDYTLTDANLRLDTAAVEKIRELEARGVRVILNSGRNLPATASLAQLIGTSDLVVAENGGVIARYQTPIKVLGGIENARAALRMLSKRMGRRVIERPDSKLGMRLSSVSLERSFDFEEAKKLIRSRRMRVDLIDTGVTYILMDRRVSKGEALVRLARIGKLSLSRSAGIGDNYNDLSLFEKVAYKIAVANAPEEVKQQADFVCTRSYGHGFLEAVAHLGL
jgi:phosphoglycolate phosphatase (TIGR01487 family)